MENLGGLNNEEEMVKVEKEEKVVEFQEKKRQPFCLWTVNGKDYQLKLKAAQVAKLENKYRKNILSIVMAEDILPLSVMLTVIQAAMEPWTHGITYNNVLKLYDKWEEDGGNQMKLQSNVIMPLMAISGFFTREMTEEIMEKIQEDEEDL